MTTAEISRAVTAGTYEPPAVTVPSLEERRILADVARELAGEMPDWLRAEIEEVKLCRACPISETCTTLTARACRGAV